MKKYISIISFFAVVTMGTSCNKSLETEALDRVGADVIWSSKANAETFVFGTYGIMRAFGSGEKSDQYTSNILSSEAHGQNVWLEYVTNTTDMGFNNWADIRRCNLIIQKVGESTGIADNDKKQLIAEAKFLRAMSYFNIARISGRIVWIDKPLTENDEFKLPSVATPTDSYNYIIKDLEEAIADLGTAKVAGRTNKYVAAAFLSEVCLQALAYKNYPAAPAISSNDPLLDKAIANAKMVIEQGGYSLESDYGGMFNETKSTSPEIIFALYNKSINTTVSATPMQGAMPNITVDKVNQYEGSPLMSANTPFEAWPSYFPATNLTDDYLTIDKNDPARAVAWNQTSQYKNAVDENVNVRATFTRIGFPYNKVGSNPSETTVLQGQVKAGSNETIWTLTNENRDARWAASIISDSTSFFGQTFTTGMHGNATRWISMYGGVYGTGYTNMYWRKLMYNNVSPRFFYNVITDYHNVCMRLGRVYLNMAEAYLLKGEVTNAVQSLNMTRTVHGKLPNSQAASLADAWTDYKRERRVDLTMENDYYYSLLRWGRYGGAANHNIAPGGTIPELTEKMRIMDISKDRKAFAVTTGSFSAQYNDRQFDANRRYLFPISQSFIDNNPNFGPQNPGW